MSEIGAFPNADPTRNDAVANELVYLLSECDRVELSPISLSNPGFYFYGKNVMTQGDAAKIRKVLFDAFGGEYPNHFADSVNQPAS